MSRLALVGVALLVAAAPAYAQDSGQAASAAVNTSAQVAGALNQSGVPATTAMSVAPALVGGASAVGVAGASVNAAATDSAGRAAPANDAYGGGALPVDDAVVVAQPAPHVPYDSPTEPK